MTFGTFKGLISIIWPLVADGELGKMETYPAGFSGKKGVKIIINGVRPQTKTDRLRLKWSAHSGAGEFVQLIIFNENDDLIKFFYF